MFNCDAYVLSTASSWALVSACDKVTSAVTTMVVLALVGEMVGASLGAAVGTAVVGEAVVDGGCSQDSGALAPL